MPVSMIPLSPPDNRMAELDALLRRMPQDAPKRQVAPKAPPAYLTRLAAELRARAVARAAHARECRARLIREKREAAATRRRESTAYARAVHQAKIRAEERAIIREALASGPVSDSTVALEDRFAAFRMLTGA